jgi:RecA-family ATPase
MDRPEYLTDDEFDAKVRDLDAAHEREGTPELEIFDVGDEDGAIRPRQWLLSASFCRAILSGLIGAGAAGKTTIRILQLLSLASGKNLSGEFVHVRSRVMIVCLEDDMLELRRRVRAAMLHYGIKPADIKGWLFLTTPRGEDRRDEDRDRLVGGRLPYDRLCLSRRSHVTIAGSTRSNRRKMSGP